MRGHSWGLSVWEPGKMNRPAWGRALARIPFTGRPTSGQAVLLWSLPALRADPISGVFIFSPLPPPYFGHALCLTLNFSSFGNLHPILHHGSGKVGCEIKTKHQCRAVALLHGGTLQSQVKKTPTSILVTETPWFLYLRLYPE